MRSSSALKTWCWSTTFERTMTRTVRFCCATHWRHEHRLTHSTAHDTKPISHHYNHRAEKANKGQPQRGRKLQFEDFEWYEDSTHDGKFNGVPGKVEMRRQPKRLSNQEQRRDNAIDNAEPSHYGEPVVTGHLHSRHHRRSRRNQEYRSS